MDLSREELQQRIASLELEVASLNVQREFDAERKVKYRRRIEELELECKRLKEGTASTTEEKDKYEDEYLAQKGKRYSAALRATHELGVLRSQMNTLRDSYSASINQLQDIIRHLEARLSYEDDRNLEQTYKLQYEISRLRAMLLCKDLAIEHLQDDNTAAQEKIREHEATELTQLHQLSEHRSEIVELKRKREKMIHENESVCAEMRELLLDDSDREREVAEKLEKSKDLTSQTQAALEDALFLQAILNVDIETLDKKIKVLSEENRRLKGLDDNTTSLDDDSTPSLGDDSIPILNNDNTPILGDDGTTVLGDDSIPILDDTSPSRPTDDIDIPNSTDDTARAGPSVNTSTARPPSQPSRRVSIQADARLAAIDARLEQIYYDDEYQVSDAEDSGYGEDENNGEQEDGVVLRFEQQANQSDSSHRDFGWLRGQLIALPPLRRMRLPPMPAGTVAEPIEAEV